MADFPSRYVSASEYALLYIWGFFMYFITVNRFCPHIPIPYFLAIIRECSPEYNDLKVRYLMVGFRSN